jgi:hypothetical protein
MRIDIYEFMYIWIFVYIIAPHDPPYLTEVSRIIIGHLNISHTYIYIYIYT